MGWTLLIIWPKFDIVKIMALPLDLLNNVTLKENNKVKIKI